MRSSPPARWRALRDSAATTRSAAGSSTSSAKRARASGSGTRPSSRAASSRTGARSNACAAPTVAGIACSSPAAAVAVSLSDSVQAASASIFSSCRRPTAPPPKSLGQRTTRTAAAAPASGQRVIRRAASPTHDRDSCPSGPDGIKRTTEVDPREGILTAREAQHGQHTQGSRRHREKEARHRHHDHPPTLGRQPAATRSSWARTCTAVTSYDVTERIRTPQLVRLELAVVADPGDLTDRLDHPALTFVARAPGG